MRVLEEESRSRLGRFNQKDVSMVFSSVMRLHPSSPHPLVESCLSSLERHLEKERHPQTLFLLLSYYRLRAQALQGHPASDQQLINNRKILRLVRHTLGQVSAMREHELALLDEMLALCAQEANNKALEAIFSSQLFYENRQERFIRSMAGRGRVPARRRSLPGARCPLRPHGLISNPRAPLGLCQRQLGPCGAPGLQCWQLEPQMFLQHPVGEPLPCPLCCVWGQRGCSLGALQSGPHPLRSGALCLGARGRNPSARSPLTPCLPGSCSDPGSVARLLSPPPAPRLWGAAARGRQPGDTRGAVPRRVASPQGGEPDALHHGPDRQVRGPAPPARAAAARYHRQLPAEARGAAGQQGEPRARPAPGTGLPAGPGPTPSPSGRR